MNKIYFVGAGKMATAIAGGLVKSGNFAATDLMAFDPNQLAADSFFKSTGAKCHVGEIDEQILEDSSTVFLAVKPQHLIGAISEYKTCLKDKLIISIVAGCSLSTIYDLTNSNRIARVMPNTPALIGQGCSVATLTPEISDAEQQFISKIFNAVGSYAVVEENLLDAVTGLSGSGPAYVFEFIQALADGGVAEGLPRNLALELAAKTVAGASQMAIQTKDHPMVLRDQVTSPGGTTIRGLEALSNSAFQGTVINAVRAATKRSKELGGTDND